LIPSGGGVFEFHLNEKLIFSKKELERHSEDGEILKLIEEELG
jgi:selenoprotein W-related protein|tara:strand:+ start:2238 stop:2366 length:129 start_codon:yes stop_codon:yes gene_type:complete